MQTPGNISKDEPSLFPKEENVNSKSPFIGRKLVIEGSFSNFKKDSIKLRIKQLGGEVITGNVTKNIHYFVEGDFVSSDVMDKLNKLDFDGYHLRILKEPDLINIFNGKYEGYYVEDVLKKDLRLTIDHFNKKHVTYTGVVTESSGRQYFPNPIYGKNMYLGQGVTGNRMILSQMLGLIGVFSGQGLSDSTQIIMLSQSAYEALKKGEQHSEIDVIQNAYNRGLAQWYDYLLTTENEFLDWYKSRFELAKDSVCESVYSDYMMSKNIQ